MSHSVLAQGIMEEYARHFAHPFPLDDVRKLRIIDKANWSQLHGELDIYFTSVAGYASGADRLWRKSKQQLLEANQYLSKSFFEKHPSWTAYRDAITEIETPDLFQRLVLVEKLRKDLLTVINDLLSQ